MNSTGGARHRPSFFSICMMKRTLVLTVCVLLTGAAAAQTIFPAERLEHVKRAYAAGDAKAAAAVAALQELAGEYLDRGPVYVTEKRKLPPSGDRRDYMTLSPYWWPDPAKPDGLPYVRRDGERNPEVYDYPERENAGLLGEAARTLALCYAVTGEERYAAKCAEWIRGWFLDPERGMNPNMAYAQLIPGRTTVRGTGIIDSRRFCYALSAASLLRGSKAWSDGDEAGLRDWVTAFLRWLEESENGRKEIRSANNHGLWYDAIRLMAVAWLGDRERAREIAEHSLAPRLAGQIAEDGSLPLELERTLSLHYSTFALEAVAFSASLTADTGYSLWSYRSPEGRSLEQVVTWLEPYYREPAAWPYRQIKPFDRDRGARILYAAGRALDREEWVRTAREIGCRPEKSDFLSLLYFDL